MSLVTYTRKHKHCEEYLDLENSYIDKARINYLYALEEFKHIQNLNIEKLDFFD